MKICEYGCGLEAKFQLKSGKWCCSEYYNSCPAIKRKNSEARKQQIIEQKENGTFKSNLGKYILKGHNAWNKGLTKETDSRIKKSR